VRKLIIWVFGCQADFDAKYTGFNRVSAWHAKQAAMTASKLIRNAHQ